MHAQPERRAAQVAAEGTLLTHAILLLLLRCVVVAMIMMMVLLLPMMMMMAYMPEILDDGARTAVTT